MALPFQDCVVLFGDSITNRQDVPSTLQALMSDHYRRALDVQNRGFGGYNTGFARELFDSIFAKKEQAANVPQVRLVTIWFGTNDACLPHNPMGQHTPLPLFRQNLEFFLESLTSSSSPYAAAHSPLSIVLITPAPMCESLLPPVPAEAREAEVTKQYVDVVNELAKEWRAKGEKEGGKWRVEGVDMWKAVLDDAAGDEEKMKGYFTDGLHLSTAGYAIFWKEYTRLVKGPLKNRGLDWDDLVDCPPRSALWDDLDHKRPESVGENMKQSPFRST